MNRYTSFALAACLTLVPLRVEGGPGSRRRLQDRPSLDSRAGSAFGDSV